MYCKGNSSNGGGLIAALVVALLWALDGVKADGDVLNIHGSGTTNPSKCYWAIMEQFEARSRHPLRNTYRAVGSTTGIEEFLNGYDPLNPANAFGSGDLPLNKTVYDTLTAAGVGIVHLPVLLGAVSFFHSVETSDKVPVQRLNLTACLLSRIFKRDITSWNHNDVVALNPELKKQNNNDADLPIRVARRVKGSSSTDSITSYLHDACPDEWPVERTGPLVEWHEDTIPCEGSGGVTDCINEVAGTIGYIDAGHGNSAGLREIELENQHGTLLSSEEASKNGGIAAAEDGVMPLSADLDFSGVSLLNRPGEFTWPIVQMTYLYVRKNLSYLTDPDEQSLLVAFLRALYDENYVQQCAVEFDFTLPSAPTVQLAKDGIAMLQLDGLANEWIFESNTLPITGMGDFVLSEKRKRISDVERSSFESDIKALEAENTEMKKQLEMLTNSNLGMTDDQEKQLTAALVLASMSFIWVILLTCIFIGSRFVGSHQPTASTTTADELNGDGVAKEEQE